MRKKQSSEKDRKLPLGFWRMNESVFMCRLWGYIPSSWKSLCEGVKYHGFEAAGVGSSSE